MMPEPVGGYEAIKKKLVYPAKAREDGIEGIVEIEVMVDELGEVQKAEVVKGLRTDVDESARIAVYYTKFKPGMQKGKPVKVQFIVPVEFKIFDRPSEENP
jgi:periplasmic protein TonB